MSLLLTRLAHAEATARKADEYQAQYLALKSTVSTKNAEISRLQADLSDMHEKLSSEQQNNGQLIQENRSLREYIDSTVHVAEEEAEKWKSKAEFTEFRYNEMESRLKSDIRVLVRKVSHMRAREIDKEQEWKEKEKKLSEREKSLELPLIYQLAQQNNGGFGERTNHYKATGNDASDKNCTNGRCGQCSLCLNLQIRHLEETIKENSGKLANEKEKLKSEKQKRKTVEKQLRSAESQLEAEVSSTLDGG